MGQKRLDAAERVIFRGMNLEVDLASKTICRYASVDIYRLGYRQSEFPRSMPRNDANEDFAGEAKCVDFPHCNDHKRQHHQQAAQSLSKDYSKENIGVAAQSVLCFLLEFSREMVNFAWGLSQVPSWIDDSICV
jgi:hypothetical protein